MRGITCSRFGCHVVRTVPLHQHVELRTLCEVCHDNVPRYVTARQSSSSSPLLPSSCMLGLRLISTCYMLSPILYALVYVSHEVPATPGPDNTVSAINLYLLIDA